MKKSLLHKEAADEIIARVKKLQPDTANHWGKMNATEMLLHCNISNKHILEDEIAYEKPGIIKKILAFVAVNILPQFPKNNKGPARTHTKGLIDTGKFEEQRQQFIDQVNAFPVRTKPFTSLHPAMGFLKTKDWGVITWMHMDHHLRQFGV